MAQNKQQRRQVTPQRKQQTSEEMQKRGRPVGDDRKALNQEGDQSPSPPPIESGGSTVKKDEQ